MGCNASIKTTPTNSVPLKVIEPSLSRASSAPLLRSIQNPEPDLVTDKTQFQRKTIEELVQDFLLVWLDKNIDELHSDFRNSIRKLRRTVDTIEMFRDADECISYISKFGNEKIFLIISGAFCESVLPITDSLPQIYSIYIFCRKASKYDKWATGDKPKVKGIFTVVDSICASVRQSARECNQETVVITGQKNPLLFVGTQLFKEILLNSKFEEKDIQDLADYAREKYINDNDHTLLIEEFSTNYQGNVDNKPIWWYTRQCFIYSMINRALGTLDIITLLKMGFFIAHLHQNIEQLQAEQYIGETTVLPNEVFRGQVMTKEDFEQKITMGELTSFNNFLSTSQERKVAIGFIRTNLPTEQNKIGVLFILNIRDRSNDSIPFANVSKISEYPHEEEVLFSTHTIFRVQSVKQIEEGGFSIQEVNLTLATEHDDLRLSEFKRRTQEHIPGSGWRKLMNVLCTMGENEKAEQLCTILSRKATNDHDQAYFCKQLGDIMRNQMKYPEALKFYLQSLDLYRKILTPNNYLFAQHYEDIGALYQQTGDYLQSLSFHNQSLEIRMKALPENHPSLATSYRNIGMVYSSLGEYDQALSYYQKSLSIQERSLPSNHPDLAQSYNNIGKVYADTGDYSQALSVYQKSLAIQEKTLPENHPDLAQSYNDIGMLHSYMGEYNRALSYYRRSQLIREITLPSNHPSLATSYNNIGMIYSSMGDYTQALSYYQKSLAIQEKILPSNHPDLAQSYNNIGMVYADMGDYSQALSFHQKSLVIQEKTLPENHPDLAQSYNNIGILYSHMGEYTRALSYYQKSLSIQEKSLPANHPDLAQSCNNIGKVYADMGEYDQAISYYQKSLSIQEKSLPANHPALGTSYSNIGMVYFSMGKYDQALSYHQKSLTVQERSLPPSHPSLATSYNNIGAVYSGMGDYTHALSYHEKSLAIQEKSLPAYHPSLATSYRNIGMVYSNMAEYTKALSFYEKAADIWKRALPVGHPYILSVQKDISYVKDKL